jgi:hypothetical protein
VRPGGFSVAAYDRAIRRAGRSDFNRDFTLFCRDVAEWRTTRIFREGDLYRDFPREGGIVAGGKVRTRLLNHTTFQMLRVRARGRAIRIDVTAPARAAAGVALVGRIGSEQRGRTVSRVAYRRRGGRLSVRLARPRRFSRITAVLVNADTRALGFSPRSLDWNYLTDTAPFRARVRVTR